MLKTLRPVLGQLLPGEIPAGTYQPLVAPHASSAKFDLCRTWLEKVVGTPEF